MARIWKTTERICQQCGTVFGARNYAVTHGEGLYCSRACASQGRRVSLDQVLSNYIEDANGCWIYQGTLTERGYPRVRHNERFLKVNRLVMARTHGVDISDRTIHACHTCDNPPCIRPDHIFPGTIQDNHADMMAKGRHHTKLSELDVRNIRAEYAAGGASHQTIAAEYGIGPTMVSLIVRGRRWKHVADGVPA